MMTKKIPDNSGENNADLLFEIGTEEIPARFLPEATEKLAENAHRLFQENAIGVESIKAYATPRRLSLFADLHKSQNVIAREIWGPPVSVAYDSNDGNPTKAAEAFAKANNISVEHLSARQKGKGMYVVAIVEEEARLTESLLPELLPKLIMSIRFPKSMRWGNGDIKFARPIHWILALFNNKMVPFEIGGIKSSRMTRGHRFLSPAAFEIKDSGTYVNLLRNNFVILDPEEREKNILEGCTKLASSVGSSLKKDEDLLRHVVFLTEYPVPVLGSFSERYLELPKELLITVMKGHQKYFALEHDGVLAHYFIAVSNTTQGNAENVRIGAERVLKARFEDARFYYEDDIKRPLMKRLEDLKKVVYHEKLGSLYDKTMRMASIAEYLASHCFKEKKEDIKTSAHLSKADLVSGVVREFPELQGIMGSYYAMHDGYNERISSALAEQYLPAYSGDRLPETLIGSVLSLSDKLDNVSSFFMLGLSPTGSEDPFALRRQTIGIISILLNSRCTLPIQSLLEKALHPFKLTKKETVMDNLLTFFEQRAEALFQGTGYPQDAVSCVLRIIRDEPLFSVKDRLDALVKYKADDSCGLFLAALKRINNIAPKTDIAPADPSLLAQEEENLLFRATESSTSRISPLLKQHLYYDAIKVLEELTAPINNFFDKVLIMDKDEKIKQNRLALLKSIQQLALQIADFSKLS